MRGLAYARGVTNPADPLPSLLTALQPNYERPVPAAAWAGFARRFLQPGERALLAVEGEGLTWVDPLLIVTDRRLMRLRRGTFLGWRLLREVPPAAVVSARVEPGMLWARIVIEVAGQRSIRMHAADSDVAKGFVAGLHALLQGRRPGA